MAIHLSINDVPVFKPEAPNNTLSYLDASILSPKPTMAPIAAALGNLPNSFMESYDRAKNLPLQNAQRAAGISEAELAKDRANTVGRMELAVEPKKLALEGAQADYGLSMLGGQQDFVNSLSGNQSDPSAAQPATAQTPSTPSAQGSLANLSVNDFNGPVEARQGLPKQGVSSATVQQQAAPSGPITGPQDLINPNAPMPSNPDKNNYVQRAGQMYYLQHPMHPGGRTIMIPVKTKTEKITAPDGQYQVTTDEIGNVLMKNKLTNELTPQQKDAEEEFSKNYDSTLQSALNAKQQEEALAALINNKSNDAVQGQIQGRWHEFWGAPASQRITNLAMNSAVENKPSGLTRIAQPEIELLHHLNPTVHNDASVNKQIILQRQALTNQIIDKMSYIKARQNEGVPVIQAQEEFNRYVQSHPPLIADQNGSLSVNPQRPILVTDAQFMANPAAYAGKKVVSSSGKSGIVPQNILESLGGNQVK